MTLVSRPALEVSQISKTFVGQRVLADLQLRLSPGEIHALLGQNGSGKSTFIKILSGYHAPDPGGTVNVDGQALVFASAESSARLGMRFVHQDLGLVDSLSIADNMCLSSGFPRRFGTIRAKQLHKDVGDALEFAGLDLDPEQPVGDLLPALRASVAIARAIHEPEGSEIKLLVLDEATATLPYKDVEEFLRTVRKIANRGVTVLYVSHHLNETFDIADTVTILRDGRSVHSSPVAELDYDSLVDKLVGSELAILSTQSLKEAGRNDTEQSTFSVSEFNTEQLDAINLSVRGGEIVGVAGITGSGRESLLSALYGAVPRLSGTVTVAGRALRPSRPDDALRAGVTYLPSDRARRSAFMTLAARENITISDVRRSWKFPRIRMQSERSEVQNWFETLNIKPRGGAEMPLSTFSGGNQQKAILARILRCQAQTLLLENPTEGVDVGAKAEIHKQVLAAAQRGMAILISSVDDEELSLLCDRVVVMHGGRIRTTLENHPDEISITGAVLGTEGDVA